MGYAASRVTETHLFLARFVGEGVLAGSPVLDSEITGDGHQVLALGMPLEDDLVARLPLGLRAGALFLGVLANTVDALGRQPGGRGFAHWLWLRQDYLLDLATMAVEDTFGGLPPVGEQRCQRSATTPKVPKSVSRRWLSVPYLAGVGLQHAIAREQPSDEAKLSVPYLAGVGLQPEATGTSQGIRPGFQFPIWREWVCNLASVMRIDTNRMELSVPYLAGVGLQLAAGDQNKRVFLIFQFPIWREWVCNMSGVAQSTIAQIDFQFPIWREWVCNLRTDSVGAFVCLISFSSLSGGSGSATGETNGRK